jgi:hypothetical protein
MCASRKYVDLLYQRCGVSQCAPASRRVWYALVPLQTLAARASFRKVARQVISLQCMHVCAHSRACLFLCQCLCCTQAVYGGVHRASRFMFAQLLYWRCGVCVAFATQASADASFVVPAMSEDPFAPLGGRADDIALPGAAGSEPETACQCGPFPSAAAMLLTPIPCIVPSGSPRGASTSVVIELASLRAPGPNGGDLCQLRLQSNSSAHDRDMQGFD